MKRAFEKLLKGYQTFREKYVQGDASVMQSLSHHGQNPDFMVVACCDSRVDPAVVLQCEPGDMFVVRNVANIVPGYEKDQSYHGTSAALEFGINYLKVKHLILLGHSQCGGIQALLDDSLAKDSDFITKWVSVLKTEDHDEALSVDECAKASLKQSHQNCMSFPWIKDKVERGELRIHLWFFDIKAGELFSYSPEADAFKSLA